MAGCGCGGSAWQADDNLVPADTQGDSYFSHRTEADQGLVTSANADDVLIAPDGVQVWNPDTGRSEDR